MSVERPSGTAVPHAGYCRAMASQVVSFLSRAAERRVVLVVIGLSGAVGCREAREPDVSAYERPSPGVADTASAVDSGPAIPAPTDESPTDESRSSSEDGAAGEVTVDEGAVGAVSAGEGTPGDSDPLAEPRPPEAADTSGDNAPSDTGQDVDVDGLLSDADAAYSGLPSLRARFHQVIDVPLLERRREGHGKWYQKGRARFKIDFDDPPDDEIVADGIHLWLFYPSTNPRQVIRSRLGASGTGSGTADVLARILEEARINYAGQYVGSETVDGVTTRIVSLRPTTRSQYRLVRVWIADQDHLVRKFEITEENETVRTVTLTSLEPGADLPDSLFRFVPPADADVFEG